ncbi:MAG: helix-turn-helix domain-containing protein [Coprococcus comes]
MITEKVGSRIKELRRALELSQEKLALKAEVDRTYLAGVEQGKRNPSIKSLEKILKALEGSFGEFFKDM